MFVQARPIANEDDFHTVDGPENTALAGTSSSPDERRQKLQNQSILNEEMYLKSEYIITGNKAYKSLAL